MSVEVEALRRTVRLQNEARRVELSAFHLRLVSLNAMIAAVRAGDSALGFGAAASHLQGLSTELEQAVKSFTVTSHRAVQAAAEAIRRQRRERLLRQAGVERPEAPGQRRALLRAERLVEDQLQDLRQLSTVGYAISRSTMIEATYCTLDPNPLHGVAETLDARASDLADTLRRLSRSVDDETAAGPG
jgi:hypothetical protein